MIYLLHFTAPLGDPSRPRMSARHYLRWAPEADWQDRIDAHRAGRGAAITRAAVAAGIELELVRTWPGEDRAPSDGSTGPVTSPTGTAPAAAQPSAGTSPLAWRRGSSSTGRAVPAGDGPGMVMAPPSGRNGEALVGLAVLMLGGLVATVGWGRRWPRCWRDTA